MKKNLNSKTVIFFLIAFLSLSFSVKEVNACEIGFEITDNKKEIYDIGDVIVIKVNVTLTHRSCPIAMKQTKFTMKGLKVIATTEWKQLSTMVWERKLKMKVIGTKDGKLVLNAIRNCDKDGGFGSLILQSKPQK